MDSFGDDDSSDVDGRPGGLRMSENYARIYDPDANTETSFRPERADELEMEIEEEELHAALNELRGEARLRVQVWPNVGRFIIPRENTYAAHAQLVESGQITFDPAVYRHTLKVMVEKADRPDLFDPSHRDYAKNAVARKNLLVLFNDIMGFYMDDGAFDPGDEKFVPLLADVARELGEALARENNPIARAFTPALHTPLLNMEGDGAMHAYRFLLSRQRSPDDFFSAVVDDVYRLLGLPLRKWGLPREEFTPFCEAGMQAPPVPDALCMNQQQLEKYCRHCLQQDGLSAAKQAQSLQARGTPEELQAARKAEAVHHGKVILEWLKNLKFTDKSVEELVDTGTPDERTDAKSLLARALEGFRHARDQFAQAFPLLPKQQEHDSLIKRFEHAISVLAKLEIANSIADTQQISTAQSQHIQSQHEEGGAKIGEMLDSLQRAVSDMTTAAQELHAEDQQRQQEEAAEQAHQALNNSTRRRRRRRRQQQQATASQAKVQRVARDIRADDYVLGQGAHAPRASAPSPAAPRPAPSAAQLAQSDVVRALGRTLADNAQAANNLPVMDVQAGDKITPDSTNLSAQEQLRREREQQNPNRLG